MTPEEFQKLPAAARAEAIAEAEAEREWYGFCQQCEFKIVAKLKVFPTSCERCGYGSND